ncbi:hypothetical protein [Microbispora sp. NPDC046933]|uniref:hypothetical protein n=1 Tax=Microbispora sp. NPDC046933 TaxID=3155618 RepID=UPI0033D4322B
MSTYLVYGGTGNVGRRVVERLARRVVFMTGGGARPGVAPEQHSADFGGEPR